jgi:hypothetical protein
MSLYSAGLRPDPGSGWPVGGQLAIFLVEIKNLAFNIAAVIESIQYFIEYKIAASCVSGVIT